MVKHGTFPWRAYILVRNIVDWDLSRRRRHGGLGRPFTPLLLIVPLVPFFAEPKLMKSFSAWVIAGCVSAAWLSFTGWRVARQTRLEGILGDRAYDRAGKQLLAKEYRDTESATAARQRHRRLKRENLDQE